MTIRICLLMVAALTAGAAPPNFVFILADDQAWNGLSRRMVRNLPESGSDFHRTPNIDRLGREGMTFSRAYAAAPKCEPSRYAITFGMTTTSLNAPDKRTAARLRADSRHSLANALKQANSSYTTATFGKWQLTRSQKELGFDRDDGRITQNRDGESPDPRDPKRMFELAQKGNRFMQDSVEDGRPFYLQLWHYAVHGSNQALPETLERWQARPPGRLHRDPTRAAMAEDFDRAVGMTLAKIDELGIRDSTYVIYMSDNGGPSRYLRGGKTNVTEGGLRVPLLVRGPGIEQDTYCDAPAVAYDLLPTVLDFADPGAVPPSRVEGGSWKPMLLSGCESGIDRPVDRMVFFFAEARGREPGPQAAIVRDNYKLLHSWAEAGPHCLTWLQIPARPATSHWSIRTLQPGCTASSWTTSRKGSERKRSRDSSPETIRQVRPDAPVRGSVKTGGRSAAGVPGGFRPNDAAAYRSGPAPGAAGRGGSRTI